MRKSTARKILAEAFMVRLTNYDGRRIQWLDSHAPGVGERLVRKAIRRLYRGHGCKLPCVGGW